MDISKWAFKNRNLVYFLVTVLLVGGILSCYQMSKLEDPEIKVKLAMVVTTYPGASAHQVELEVTDVLEKSPIPCILVYYDTVFLYHFWSSGNDFYFPAGENQRIFCIL